VLQEECWRALHEPSRRLRLDMGAVTFIDPRGALALRWLTTTDADGPGDLYSREARPLRCPRLAVTFGLGRDIRSQFAGALARVAAPIGQGLPRGWGLVKRAFRAPALFRFCAVLRRPGDTYESVAPPLSYPDVRP